MEREVFLRKQDIHGKRLKENANKDKDEERQVEIPPGQRSQQVTGMKLKKKTMIRRGESITK